MVLSVGLRVRVTAFDFRLCQLGPQASFLPQLSLLCALRVILMLRPLGVAVKLQRKCATEV